MPSPVLQSSSVVNWSSGNGTIAKPAGTVDGDLLILTVSYDLSASEDHTTTPPAGFTQLLALTRSHPTNAGVSSQVWYKIASSEPANYTITPDSDNLAGASMLRIDGHDGADPFDVSQITAYDDSTEAKVPSVTTTVTDTLIVGIVTWDQTKSLNSVPAGWTAEFHIDVSGLDQHGIQKDQAAAAATGVGQYDISSASPHVGATIAIQVSTGVDEASVSPVVATFTVPAVTAISTEISIASVSPVVMTLSIPAVTVSTDVTTTPVVPVATPLPKKKVLFILESRNPSFRHATENWDFIEIVREINGSSMVRLKTDQMTTEIANAITDPGNRLTIRISTDDTGSAGLNYFSGFIPSRGLNLKPRNQSVEITAFGFASRLFDIPYRDGTTINMDKTAGVASSAIATDVIDKAIVLDAQLPLTYDAVTVEASGDTVKDKFILAKSGEAINRASRMAFDTDRIWHWFVDGDSIFYFKKNSTVADHQFVYGRNIIEFPEFTEELPRSLNEALVVYNGGANIKRVFDQASIDDIGIRSDTFHETNVPDATTAEAIGNAHLASRIPPILTVSVTIGGDFPIESINPGDTCRLDNVPPDIQSLLNTNMFIVRTTYRRYTVDLVLSLKHPFISNQVEQIRRKLEKESIETISALIYA